MNLRPFTTIISLNNALVRSEVRRRKWLLPPLVRTSVPEPVKRNLLDVALWVFSFNLPDFFGLRGIAKFAPFRKLTPGLKPVDYQHLLDYLSCGTRFALNLGLFALFLLFCNRLGRD